MWNSFHISFRPQRFLWNAQYSHPLYFRRYATQKAANDSAENDLSPEKRFTSILVAFGVGCSIYLFLDDPRQPQKNEVSSLSPRRFSLAQLTSCEESTSNTKLIELTIPPKLLPQRLDNFSPIWSVYIKDDDIQVERPYTPLQGISHGRLQFWIKNYPHGEVSRWIHSKKVGDKIEIRCPLTTWTWKDDVWDEVVMVSNENCPQGWPDSKFVIDRRWHRHYPLRATFQYQNFKPPTKLEDSLYPFAFFSNTWGITPTRAFEPLDYLRQGTTREV